MHVSKKKNLKAWYCLNITFIFLGLFLVSSGQAGAPTWGTFKTIDGQQLRTVLYDVPKSNGYPLTIVFLQGRASFIEKYQNTLEKLNGMGYRVWSFDWRGQGGSPRAFPNQPHKLHIDSFDTYLADLDLFLREKVRSQTAAPLVLIGSSSGGHLAFRYLEDYPGKVQGAILISPMLEVFTPPVPRFLAPFIVRLFCWLGLSQSYAIGHGDFDMNKNTNDSKTSERQPDFAASYPQLVTGGVTYGWANAMFKSLKKEKNHEALKNITVPVLSLEGGKDRVVDHSQNDYFEKFVPIFHRIIYEEGSHNLMKENQEILNEVWKEIASFLKNKV